MAAVMTSADWIVAGYFGLMLAVGVIGNQQMYRKKRKARRYGK